MSIYSYLNQMNTLDNTKIYQNKWYSLDSTENTTNKKFVVTLFKFASFFCTFTLGSTSRFYFILNYNSPDQGCLLYRSFLPFRRMSLEALSVVFLLPLEPGDTSLKWLFTCLSSKIWNVTQPNEIGGAVN